MKKYDLYLILAVIIIILAAFLFYYWQPAEGDTVIIRKNGVVLHTASLSDDARFVIDEKNTVVITDEMVFMESADCPDQLCVRQGSIQDSRKEIICLPNQVVVSVVQKSEIDSVSR